MHLLSGTWGRVVYEPRGRKGAFGGAKASQHFNKSSGCRSPQQIMAVWRIPFQYHTMRAHSCACCLLFLVPCCRGVPFTLVSSNTPWSARTHHPPFAPVSPGLLLCGSLFHSLPPILSCSPLLYLSCCSSLFLSHCGLPPLSLSLSLSLSPKKGGFGLFGASQPPRGSNHPPRDRRGVVYPLSHDDRVSAPCAPLFFSFVSPPVMRIFFRMGVCSAVCRGTAQRPRVPGPPA